MPRSPAHPSARGGASLPAEQGDHAPDGWVEPAQDFAFADTVIASGLDLPPEIGAASPEAYGAVWQDPEGYCDPGIATRVRFAWDQIRHDVKTSRDEMNLLWDATADDSVHSHPEHDPLHRLANIGQRVRTLFSFFEWDRADMLRAAWIGLAVFVLVATVAAVILQVERPQVSFDHSANVR